MASRRAWKAAVSRRRLACPRSRLPGQAQTAPAGAVCSVRHTHTDATKDRIVSACVRLPVWLPQPRRHCVLLASSSHLFMYVLWNAARRTPRSRSRSSGASWTTPSLAACRVILRSGTSSGRCGPAHRVALCARYRSTCAFLHWLGWCHALGARRRPRRQVDTTPRCATSQVPAMYSRVEPSLEPHAPHLVVYSDDVAESVGLPGEAVGDGGATHARTHVRHPSAAHA